MIACAVFAAAGGCSVPWSETFSRTRKQSADANIPAGAAPESAHATASPGPGDSNVSPAAIGEPAAGDLSAVFDKILAVRKLDPSAEPILLEQLRQTPPDAWSLVAEQFRASLAYRQELSAAGRTSRSSTTADAQAPINPASITDVGPRSKDDGAPSARFNPFTGTAQAEAAALPRETELAIPATSEAAAAHASAAPQAAHGAAKGNALSVVPANFETASHSFNAETVALQAEQLRVADAGAAGRDWRELARTAAEELRQRAAASPTTTAEVHEHVRLRLLHLAIGETNKALEPIPHISPTEQDYWSRQLFALATYLDHQTQPEEHRRAAASVLQLDQAIVSLRELSSLSLRNLSFCKNVYGYGAIELYDEDVFSPGQQIAMYVEVENYRSVSTPKGYRTALASTYEILSEDGSRVTGGEIPEVEDFCRTRRRDFHIQYGLTLPPAIAPGQYRLQLVIKDRQSDKIGHAAAPFKIGGGPGL